MNIANKTELCNVLLKWLQTFNLKGPHKTIDDICDGVAMAQALNQIAPEWFSITWLSKMKTDVGDNWRLKVSNLKKLIEGIIDYYQEYLNQPFPEFGKPDALKIGEEKDGAELVKLMQLIIGCAVNCNRKQEYIKSIMQLEESVQNVIMEMIQELEHLLGSTPLSFNVSLNVDSESQVQQLLSELELIKEARDQMTRKCLELDMQVSLLQEEKTNILDEKKRLEEHLQEIIDDPIKDNIPRKQIEALKEEVFKLETSRDDYRLKLELQEKQMMELQSKFDAIQQTAVEARHLKDEVDILRENYDKVEKLESTIQSYKKKLEEMSELKREMKILENKNLSYVQHTMELEEELKKANMWKPQIEVYKKQIAELRSNLNEETKKLDKMEFENMKAQEKLNALQKEKERIILERDTLKEANEELICSKLQLKSNDETDIDKVEGKAGTFSEGIMSTAELKREIARLQVEKELLKINQKDEKSPELQVMVDDVAEQNKLLQMECRRANQRILELEAELKEINEKGKTTVSDIKIKELQNQLQFEKNQHIADVVEKDRVLGEQKQVASLMQDTIYEKDQEIQELEEKYKKCIGKARKLEKLFDSCDLLGSDAEINDLRIKMLEKQSRIDELEKRFQQSALIKDTEEKLISTAFYNLAQKKQREIVDQRLTNTNSISGTQPFLSKQRQSSVRRISATYSSK